MLRTFGRTIQILIDLTVLSVAFWLAFAVRFDWDIPAPMLSKALVAWPALVGTQYAFLSAAGVPRIAWRYVSLGDVLLITSSTALASSAFLVLRFVAAATKHHVPAAEYALLPLGVNAVDFVLSFLCVAGVRVVRRLIAERVEAASRVRRAGAIAFLLCSSAPGRAA
jgi:FlaA1/EpsC-like NDP-sugar epimerase